MQKQQNRDSNGRFVKTPKTAKIYGDAKGLPWNDTISSGLGSDPKNYFLVDFGGEDFYFYDPVKSVKNKWGFSREDINSRVKNCWWTEISYSTLQREFPNHMDKINEILGLVTAKKETNSSKLTIDDIKIGSLYYNLTYQVVERVIDIQGRLIYTSYHKMECNPFGVHTFRKATQKEVDDYLAETEEMKESLE